MGTTQKAKPMDEIDQLIAKKTERLEKIERDAEIVRAEINALRQAKEALAAAKAVSEEYQNIHLQQLHRRA